MNVMKSRVSPNSAQLAAITLLAALAAGCGPQNNHHEPVARAGGHGLRAVCADDIQKFCANDQRKRRCLRDNIDKLSGPCKAALQERIDNRGNN